MTLSSTRPGWRTAAALLLGASLSGCSVAKLAYNNSDLLLLRKIDDYLELSADQSRATRERLRQRREEHRRQELPAYLAYLRRTRALVADALSPREAEWIIHQGRALAEITLERTIPAFVLPLSDLSPEQIQHLEKQLEKRNRRFRRKFLPPSKRERFMRSVQRTTRRIEHWTGPLSTDQRQRVVELRRAFPEITEDWFSYNTGKQQSLLALLRNGADRQALSDFITGWWVRLEGSTPRLEGRIDGALESLSDLLVGVDASLESSQRRRLLRRLDSYIEQIEELMAEQ